jgi:tetratricopeptide (TPR) repeat protein
MGRSRFLEIPGEIREAIYHQVLRSANNKEDLGNHYKKYNFDLSLFRTCKQIHNEAREVFRRDNIFIAIQTPWPEAQQHVAIDGYVPIVISGDKAQRFKDEYLTVDIESGMLTLENAHQPTRKFVILLDDLPLFTEMCKYSDLSYPGLNAHLRLTLTIRNPYQLEFEQRPVPKALQRKLFEPFGMLKALNDVRIRGEHYESIEKAMRDEMAVPYPTVEKCLDESTRLKNEGNEALQKQKYHEALRLYREAFLPLCIVCDGRRRSVWGDAYFQKECCGGAFDGQDAQTARFLLRVRLVSNTIMAYLKLQDYEEAKFWGMRSIELLPGGMEGDAGWLQGFTGSHEVGKIYYRTGVACREMGERGKARDLMVFAAKYLPNDKTVQKDLAALSPRIL